MIKYVKLAVAAVMTAAIPFSAEAFPIALKPTTPFAATLIASVCAPAFHRGPHGGCRPNGSRPPFVCRTVPLPMPHRVCG